MGGNLSPPPAVFKALIEAIPAEENAAFIAQAGEHGRMTSRAGTVEMGSNALTVAAIDKLNAAIFPPDQLRTLEQTGLAEFDFEVPGIDGTFTALAGSGPDDRWVNIRRRRTAAPAGLHPGAAVIAAPPGTRGSDDQPDFASDQADFAGLAFPPRGADSDPGALTVPDDIFERPEGAALTESLDREWPQTDTPATVAAHSARARPVLGSGRPARRLFRGALAAAGCLVVAVLVANYVGATRPPPGGPAAASQPSPAAPPPAQASAPPQQPASPAAVPQATSPAQTAPSSAPAAQTPAAQAPAAQTVRSEAPPRGAFSVQVAAVRTRDEADRMVTRFVSQGYPAYFVRGEGAAANFYRVRIGTFPDRESAERAANQLEGTQGIKPWIVKESPENKTAASPMPPRESHSNRP